MILYLKCVVKLTVKSIMGFSHKYVLFLLIFSMLSCSPSHDGSTDLESITTGSIVLNPNPDPELEVAATSVFVSSCVSCHNGTQTPDLRIAAIPSLRENAQYVSIGRGEASSLYRRMIGSGGNPMPPTLLADSESNKIKAWIDDLGIITEGPGDSEPAATFAEVEAIVGPKCYGCHANTSPIFGNYSSILNLIVTPNNLDSFLYTSVTTGSSATGSLMPKNQPPLSQEEINIIESWIMDGALDN